MEPNEIKERPVRVRFAPSPTGNLHVGGARTALFNWMYARSQSGGQFILRIEDTDCERSKVEYLDEIMYSMQWLGLNWDELYKQSDRFAIYREYADRLLAENKAYRDGEAVILRMPAQQVKVFDLIRGEISFESETLKDQVLLKSDGSPTYSFACVIDDALMNISHVIRGEDHISNTPKQIVMYQALGFKPPKFAHLPLILDEEGGRMSKRYGAVAVSDYRRQGYLPEALVNYLMLLGWSPGNNQEKTSVKSALAKFSLKKINKAGAVFSLDKLRWLNGEYVKELDTKRLTDLLIPFLEEKGYLASGYDRDFLERAVHLYKDRIGILPDFLERADYLFLDSFAVEEESRQKHLLVNRKKEFELLAGKFAGMPSFEPTEIEAAFRVVVAELNIKAADLVHPVRVALTGKSVGISLFETMALLGKEKTVARLRKAFLGAGEA